MRRTEKEWKDDEGIAGVLRAAEWGVLGLVSPDGLPLQVPLNFVAFEGNLFFHGAREGEKMAAIQAGTACSFVVVEALAQIPSYAFDPERACPASQYFRSVIVYGRVAPVEDLGRKARVLQALMEKIQPEGGYRPVDAADPLYQGSVKNVAILELSVERVSGKFEVGRRLTPEKREAVTEILRRRGTELDLRTLEAMGDPGSPGCA